MTEKLLAALFLVVLSLLLYGAGLVVADREQAFANRQALKKQNKKAE